MTAKKPAPAKAAPKTRKRPAMPGAGRPRIPFDGTDKEKVRLLARVGTPQAVIASLMGCSVDTLDRRFRVELNDGLEHATALVAGTLFQRALAGDITALIWWEKTRAGHRETTRHEHGGLNGKPIELRDMSNYSDDELDLLERAANLLAGGVAQPGD